jgi:hypothetical protein
MNDFAGSPVDELQRWPLGEWQKIRVGCKKLSAGDLLHSDTTARGRTLGNFNPVVVFVKDLEGHREDARGNSVPGGCVESDVGVGSAWGDPSNRQWLADFDVGWEAI